MKTFKALESTKTDQGNTLSIIEKSIDDLPEGEILIKVNYSSLNYKDALSASGAPGVTRNYPHTPGIDASGIVEQTTDSKFKEGDSVIVTGYDLGMNTAGGFGEYIRVPSSWVINLPKGLTEKDSMILGTAGLTAGLSIQALDDFNSNDGLSVNILEVETDKPLIGLDNSPHLIYFSKSDNINHYKLGIKSKDELKKTIDDLKDNKSIENIEVQYSN